MILRRIAEHVKKHDWFAVAVDLAVVIVGVFAGMQAQNWNNQRADRALAAAYGARLVQDLKYEAWLYDFVIAYYGEVRDNASRAIEALTASGASALTDEELVVAAYRASQYLFYAPRRATFDALVATGDFGLISDPRLRETAISVFSDINIEATATEAKTSDYRRLFRRMTPAGVQEALLRKCGDKIIAPGDRTHIVGALNYPCALDLPAPEIAAAAAALRSNPDLLDALRLRFADLETAILGFETGDPEMLAGLRAYAAEDPQ